MRELQATFRHSLPKVRQDEPDEKAFDFEIDARAGRKDIVPRLVLVGFKDIDIAQNISGRMSSKTEILSCYSVVLHSHCPIYSGRTPIVAAL